MDNPRTTITVRQDLHRAVEVHRARMGVSRSRFFDKVLEAHFEELEQAPTESRKRREELRNRTERLQERCGALTERVGELTQLLEARSNCLKDRLTEIQDMLLGHETTKDIGKTATHDEK